VRKPTCTGPVTGRTPVAGRAGMPERMVIETTLTEQHKFVTWWNGAVGGNPDGRGRRKEIPGTRYLSFREAEDLTGMKHQRVSDLGKLP
jgi:hypothetical protein